MDVGTNDMGPIFCQNFFRKTHTLIEIFHKKFPIFSFMDKPSENQGFLEILLEFFYRRKKVEFCYEKISIEMCIFLRGFLQNIGLTSLGPVSMLIFILLYIKHVSKFCENV